MFRIIATVAPDRILVIASVERTGSTLLCSVLRATGVAGNPIEYANIHTRNFLRLADDLGVPRIRTGRRTIGRVRRAVGRYPWRNVSWFEDGTFGDYLRDVAASNATPNGVFGIKVHWNQYRQHLLDLGFDAGSWGAPVSWVRLTRRNEVAQAVSFVRASQTRSWNSNMSVRADATYDADAIEAALVRIADENANWDRYLNDIGASPLHATFEELIGDLDSTVRRILSSVGAEAADIPAPTTEKQSGSSSREWIERFLAERPQHQHRAGG
jgi:LPS sulfotransferase NodH